MSRDGSVNRSLLLCIALPVGLGLLAGMATQADARGEWYKSLKKPPWQPPSYVFGPVWTLLYILMGVAAWRVWKAGGGKQPMILYGVQLVLNIAWSFLFFKAHNITWALFDIVALLSVLVATTSAFFRVDRTAGYLMMPYLAWVTFATALTFSVYSRNKQARG